MRGGELVVADMSSTNRAARARILALRFATVALSTALAGIAVAFGLPHADAMHATTLAPERTIGVDARIDAEISSGQAYTLLEELTSNIGARVTGTAAGEKAEAFAYEQFKRFGYADARYQPFSFHAWTRGPLSLEVDGRFIAAAALGHTPARAELKAELIDIGNGNPEDYARAQHKVRGKIVLAYSGKLPGTAKEIATLPRYEKLVLARQHGAIAAIFINTAAGNNIGVGTGITMSATEAPLAAVVIGREDGMALKARLAEAPLPVSLSMTNSLFQSTPRNVVAILEGADLAEEHIVFGAHLDSWDLATGALDNGVGTVTVLEVARALKAAGYRPRRTIHFVLYMGEEQGMHGSRAHAAHLAHTGLLAKVKYMFNTDMSIDPLAFNLWGFPAEETFYQELADSIREYIPAFEGRVVSRPMPGGDSDPYQRRGIPILYLNGRLTPELLACQHADCDTLDIVGRDELRNTVRISAHALKSLADADELPAQVLKGEALEAYKRAHKL